MFPQLTLGPYVNTGSWQYLRSINKKCKWQNSEKKKKRKRRGYLSAKEMGLPGSVDWRRTWPVVWREVPSLWWTLQVLSHLESPPVHSKTSPVNQMRQTWHMYPNSFRNHHLETFLYNTTRTSPFYIFNPPPKDYTKRNSTKRFQDKPDIQNHHWTTHLFWTVNLWPELQQPHDHLVTEQSGHSCYFRFSSMTCNQQTICFSHIKVHHRETGQWTSCTEMLLAQRQVYPICRQMRTRTDLLTYLVCHQQNPTRYTQKPDTTLRDVGNYPSLLSVILSTKGTYNNCMPVTLTCLLVFCHTNMPVPKPLFKM